MSQAMCMHTTGGPEVLQWEEVTVGDPGPGEVRMRHTAVGLNYIDIYHRCGWYQLPGGLPAIPGMEGAGVVVAVGRQVSEFRVGDRAVYAGMPPGAYAEERLIPAHRLVKLPESIGEQQAAAMMLKGMTAQYLLRRTYRVKAGDTILIHAAAGGVGLIVCQWAKHLGAKVIGTVGTAEKASIARSHGCDHPLLYRESDWVTQVRELTAGQGVAVVYDSIGRDTFMRSLDCLQPLGMLVSFGQASGPVAPFDPGILAAKGSLYLTRPTLMTYTSRREDLLATASELFEIVSSGAVRVEICQTYPLRDVALAHRDLEAGRTKGSTVLLP